MPLFLLAGIFCGFPLPVSFGNGIAFIVALILSILLAASITVLLVISLFWTVSGEGLLCLMPHLSLFLSGVIVPLPLFPSWLKPIINFQPLRGIIDIPCQLYMGIIPLSQCYIYYGFQLAWLVFFVLVGKKLMNRALKRFVIQGG